MPLRREKIAPLSGREEKNKKIEAWWLREDSTYVTCSNTERNLFKRSKKKGKNMSEE
jgi:hypothetical protein